MVCIEPNICVIPCRDLQSLKYMSLFIPTSCINSFKPLRVEHTTGAVSSDEMGSGLPVCR